MNEIGTFVLAAFGGAIAWFLTAFVGGPIRRFYDLRREVNRCLVEYGNVLARHRERRLSDDDGCCHAATHRPFYGRRNSPYGSANQISKFSS